MAKKKKKKKRKKPVKRSLVSLGMILSGKNRTQSGQKLKDRRSERKGSKNKQREYLEEQEKDVENE